MRSKYYPKEVFNINMDITRANMARYDKAQEKIEKAILEKFPNYYKMNFKERWEIRAEIRDIEEQFSWF